MAAQDGVGQSYGIPGQKCVTADFENMRLAGRVQEAWKSYCDCMFLEHTEVTDFTLNGGQYIRCEGTNPDNPSVGRCYFVGLPPPAPSFTMQQTKEIMKGRAAEGKVVGLRVHYENLRSAEWTKCVSSFCALPGGCDHPLGGGMPRMPFNIHPGAAISPWEDVGAGARMISVREAGLFVDISRFFVVDEAAYRPLKLWQTFWQNPTLYGILMAKQLFVPVMAIATILQTVTGPPFVLIPGALEECKQRGLDPGKEVWEVAGKGLIDTAKFAISYVGQCGFGIPGACGVAVAVQKAAQDQIESHEIDQVQSEMGKVIIIFIASYGKELVDAIVGVVKAGDIMSGAEGVFHTLALGVDAGLRFINTLIGKIDADGLPNKAERKADLKALAAILSTFTMVFHIAELIAHGIAKKVPAMDIADGLAYELLGFHPKIFFSLMSQGKKESAADTAKEGMQLKGTTVEDVMTKSNMVVKTLDDIIAHIDALSRKLGGAIDGLVHFMDTVRAPMVEGTNAVRKLSLEIDQQTRVAFNIPAGGLRAVQTGVPLQPAMTFDTNYFRPGVTPAATPTVAPTPAPTMFAVGTAMPTVSLYFPVVPFTAATVAPVTPPATVTPTRPPATQPPTITVTPTKPPVKPVVVAKPSSTPLLLGTGIGFMLGGPVGAVAGAAAVNFIMKK